LYIISRRNNMTEKDLLNSVQDEYFNLDHKQIKGIYVDMELLQDLRLGTLLTSVRVKSEIAYIYSRMTDYNMRVDNDTCSYFPALKYTEQNLVARMHENGNDVKVCGLSPFTTALDYFMYVLDRSLKGNQMVGKSGKLDVNINVADIRYTKTFMDMFIKHVAGDRPLVNVIVTNYPRYEYPIQLFQAFDIFFLYDIRDLVKENSSSAAAFIQHGSFFGKDVFSPPYIDRSMHNDPDEYARILTSTATGLDLFCNFKYIGRNIKIHKET